MPRLYSDLSDITAATDTFRSDGYCTFTELLSREEITTLIAAVEEALAAERLRLRDSGFTSFDDVIYAHPYIEQICKHPAIVSAASALIGHRIELQHAKLNAKAKKADGADEVRWHQDYPFYPHTNFDMLSCVIHLDDEEIDSGPMAFVPGSHRFGPQSHLNEKGEFAFSCAPPDARFNEPELLLARRGWLSFHHALTLHYSAPKTNDRDRRLIVFQYRAIDAMQIGGVVWKCNGYQVDPDEPVLQTARFPDGTIVEVRGNHGRLYDIHGILAPNTAPKSY